ncbi:membrane protein [bacteria symbiont BFo1 of Frankliniella occidentalis]|nr:membrane protein [bacteria symbiont BFo1 of Frankliniella occidentalis]
MTEKNSLHLIVLAVVFTSVLLCFTYFLMRPVEIVAVHQDAQFSDVLVKHFPLTERGKIDWWLANKDTLKKRYNFPKPDKKGNFSVVFWDFGDGYMEEGKYDRRCFSDMKPPINCIEKNKEFTVETGRGSDMLFGVYDGIYRLKANGEMTKEKY